MYTFNNQKMSTNQGIFYLEENNTRVAWMEYQSTKDKEHKITIMHTEIDPSKKGMGLGKVLLQEVLMYVKEQNLQLIAQCPFVKAQLEKDEKH
jgi:predicted GNAT family acetyltransferase